jgi:hypothetical protein
MWARIFSHVFNDSRYCDDAVGVQATFPKAMLFLMQQNPIHDIQASGYYFGVYYIGWSKYASAVTTVIPLVFLENGNNCCFYPFLRYSACIQLNFEIFKNLNLILLEAYLESSAYRLS